MRNLSILLIVALFSAVFATGCSRGSVEQADVEKAMPEQMNAKGMQEQDAAVMPTENLPDVDISPSAEIPSDKDVTNIKVPDVEINATKGIGDMDDTRVDAIDDTVDEP